MALLSTFLLSNIDLSLYYFTISISNPDSNRGRADELCHCIISITIGSTNRVI